MTNNTAKKTTWEEFQQRWSEVSKQNIFRQRLFLEEFSSIWNKTLNKDLRPSDVFNHKFFMRSFSVFDRYVVDKPGQQILELGSPNGKCGIRIARHLPQSKITIAALDSDSYKITKVLLEHVEFHDVQLIQGQADNLPLPAGSFDLVFIDAVSLETADFSKALEEAARVLRAGGQIVISLANRRNLIYKFYRLLTGSNFQFVPQFSLAAGETKNLVQSAGLQLFVIKGFELGYDSYSTQNTARLSWLIGRAVNKLVNGLDKLTNGSFTLTFGLGLFVVAGKPIADNEKELRGIEEIYQQAKQPLPSDGDLKRVEIIILKYKDPEVETECAKQILENTNWPYKLNLFDNRPGTKNMSKIWNKLIRESTCDYVMIMDSDVLVPKLQPCWLTRLMSTFFEKEDCYVVMPKVTVTSCSEQKATQTEDLPPERINARFAGMCVLYKKDIFSRVGYFDEEFLLRGSDIEWADRLHRSGYHAYIRPDVLAIHEGSHSSKKASKKAEYNRSLERIYANTLYAKKAR